MLAGVGWPDPTEPGVPVAAKTDGWHWMAWPGTGEPTMGEWSSGFRRWVVCFWGEMVVPAELAHLDYVGTANPPNRLFAQPRVAMCHPGPGAASAEANVYMTTKKPIVLAASPRAVFDMLDHTEDRPKLVERIEQFCSMIPDPEAAAVWRRDLLFLLYEARTAPKATAQTRE